MDGVLESSLRKEGKRDRSIFSKNNASLGRVLPHAIELEEAVLCGLVTSENQLDEVVEYLRIDSFYKESHQKIFRAILELAGKSEPYDIVSVAHYLNTQNELDVIGGYETLVRISGLLPSAANVQHHARLLQQYSIRRELIQVTNTIQGLAFENEEDVFNTLDKSEQSLFEILNKNIKQNYQKLPDAISEAMEILEARRKSPDGITGVPSGFMEVDKVTAGFQPGNLIIVAGRPGMGKTAFVLSLARNVAVGAKRGVAFFSLEMPTSELVFRLISAEAEVENEKLTTGNLDSIDYNKISAKIRNFETAPLTIDDNASATVLEIRAKCRRLKSQDMLDLVIIDYIQLISGPDHLKGNREQTIAYISRSLKQMAKELKVPVIGLAQLSRKVEERGKEDKIPQLSDLRESGSLEQDADMVIFLYRPEYYKLEQDENGQPTKDVGRVIIAKNRNGSMADVSLKFTGKYIKFSNWEADYSQGAPDFSTAFSGGSSKYLDSFNSGAPAGANTTILQSKINKNKGANNGDLPTSAPGEMPF